MPRDRPATSRPLKDNGAGASAAGSTRRRGPSVRSLIKDSHAYQGIPKDQSGGIPLKFED